MLVLGQIADAQTFFPRFADFLLKLTREFCILKGLRVDF
jgi:hypothetical protein